MNYRRIKNYSDKAMEIIYQKELDNISILLNEYYIKSYINEEESYCENLKIWLKI